MNHHHKGEVSQEDNLSLVNLLDQNQTLLLISMIPRDQNYLQDCGLV